MNFLQKTLYATLLILLFSSDSFADCAYELFSISSTRDTKIIDFVEQLSDECEFSIIVSDPYAEKKLKKSLNKKNIALYSFERCFIRTVFISRVSPKLKGLNLRVDFYRHSYLYRVYQQLKSFVQVSS